MFRESINPVASTSRTVRRQKWDFPLVVCRWPYHPPRLLGRRPFFFRPQHSLDPSRSKKPVAERLIRRLRSLLKAPVSKTQVRRFWPLSSITCISSDLKPILVGYHPELVYYCRESLFFEVILADSSHAFCRPLCFQSPSIPVIELQWVALRLLDRERIKRSWFYQKERKSKMREKLERTHFVVI